MPHCKIRKSYQNNFFVVSNSQLISEPLYCGERVSASSVEYNTGIFSEPLDHDKTESNCPTNQESTYDAKYQTIPLTPDICPNQETGTSKNHLVETARVYHSILDELVTSEIRDNNLRAIEFQDEFECHQLELDPRKRFSCTCEELLNNLGQQPELNITPNLSDSAENVTLCNFVNSIVNHAQRRTQNVLEQYYTSTIGAQYKVKVNTESVSKACEKNSNCVASTLEKINEKTQTELSCGAYCFSPAHLDNFKIPNMANACCGNCSTIFEEVPKESTENETRLSSINMNQDVLSQRLVPSCKKTELQEKKLQINCIDCLTEQEILELNRQAIDEGLYLDSSTQCCENCLIWEQEIIRLYKKFVRMCWPFQLCKEACSKVEDKPEETLKQKTSKKGRQSLSGVKSKKKKALVIQKLCVSKSK